MPKIVKIPRQAVSQNSLSKEDKHTYSNCYSITVRTGRGINLGSNSTQAFIQAFTSHSPDILAYILVREKEGLDEHFQGGVFYKTHPIKKDNARQDKIRENLLPYVIQMYKDDTPNYTEKQLANVTRNALKVVDHTDFPHLFSYCTKHIDGDYSLIEKELWGPFKPIELAPHIFCEHNWRYWLDEGPCRYGCNPPTGIKNVDLPPYKYH